MKEKPNTGNKKSVRFAYFDDVLEVRHIKDMCADEIDSVWMSDEERAAIRAESLRLVGIMNREGQASGELVGQCLRGLDQHQQSYTKKSKEALNQLYDIVSECQAFEDLHGVRVPEDLLAKYMNAVSSRSEVEARSRGMNDMEAVSSIYFLL
jgi:hypothetical protein